MVKHKHTPGPWVVGPTDDTVVTHLGADGLRYEVAAIDGDYNQPEVWPVMEANARLIAAAPDLLSIARRWAAIDGGAWNVQRYASERAELMADTRAAIAKATGEAAE